jgi:hypothetical protein
LVEAAEAVAVGGTVEAAGGAALTGAAEAAEVLAAPVTAGAGLGDGITCGGASRSSVTQDPGYDESIVKLNP